MSTAPWGYEALLEALADPDHERRADLGHWSGGNFVAGAEGIDSILERFNRLAKLTREMDKR